MDKWTIIIIVSLTIGILTMVIGLFDHIHNSEENVCERTCYTYNMNLSQPVIGSDGLYCECESSTKPKPIVEAIR